ncbi:disintegrin and metalloproteinase domain-containing protein 32-like isoform X3 [Oryctolagus cuniculus]|uniref:disintegrin and metalloproteinase domain-containing protein 32-like isoform X3 n=1 Tax=Oryctolagus cuniculus TaxID=9986 RepID=UPI0038798177
MLRLLLLLAGLRGCPAPRPDSLNSFLQIILPEKIQANASGKFKVRYDQMSYIIPINETLYTVHLKQRYFLVDTFMVYLYNQGSESSHSSHIQPQCYYQGYVEGYPNSIVTLSTCSGLRGILQFENVSYGIEPLESTVQFQHILYKLGNDNKELSSFNNDTKSLGKYSNDYNIYVGEKPEPPVPDIFPLYLEMYIVVDKALYEYLGSDSMIVTSKFIEIIGLINSMFTQFKITVMLSSLELWSDENKISTVGEAEELLQIFLKWKQSYLNLRPHDTAYLFIYRDYPDYVGAVFSGKICAPHYSAGVAVYPKEMTLEAFSVVVSQMLALSLGISYDDPKKCHCSEAICIMNPRATTSSGAKTFSSCSLSDFESFISNQDASCLQNKPQMQRQKRAVCGNRIVETGEDCDCGTQEQCGPQKCCDHRTCRLKEGLDCFEGPCCSECRFKGHDIVCRNPKHHECDFFDYCTGRSAQCPEDRIIMNGHPCRKGTSMCFEGDCPDLNERCRNLFGPSSQIAPFECYEEIQSQMDRYGNCGKHEGKYRTCARRDLLCGRLICTYPSTTPYNRTGPGIIYALVRSKLCVTLDYRLNESDADPMDVRNGSACGTEKICINRRCVESKGVKTRSKNCMDVLCSGNGMCTNFGVCHCFSTYYGSMCHLQRRGSLPGKIDQDQKVTLRHTPVNTDQKAAAKQLLSMTSNSSRRQWMTSGISQRNENSTFPTLVTAEGINKLSVDELACQHVCFSFLFFLFFPFLSLFFFPTYNNAEFNHWGYTSDISGSLIEEGIPTRESLVLLESLSSSHCPLLDFSAPGISFSFTSQGSMCILCPHSVWSLAG